jgi:ribonuclease Z
MARWTLTRHDSPKKRRLNFLNFAVPRTPLKVDTSLNTTLISRSLPRSNAEYMNASVTSRYSSLASFRLIRPFSTKPWTLLKANPKKRQTKSLFETALETQKAGSALKNSSSELPQQIQNRGERVKAAVRHNSIAQLAALLESSPQAKPAAVARTTNKLIWKTGNASKSLDFINDFSRASNYYKEPPILLGRPNEVFKNTQLVRAPGLNHPERKNSYWVGYTPCGDTRPLLSPAQAKTAFTVDTRLQPMKAYLQFITVPTADTPGTVLVLHFDSKRYLVGQIGEGTQRACVENGISLRKLEDLFITGKCNTESTGGIIGMILTVADVVAASRKDESHDQKIARRKARAQRQQRGTELASGGGWKAAAREENAHADPSFSEDTFLTMYGPPNLTHSLAAARRFVFRRGLPIKVHEMRGEEPVARDELGRWLPTFSDEYLRVWAMSIKPSAENGREPTETSPRKARKRTFDEANSVPPEPTHTETGESDAEREHRHDQMRKAVVADMFSSTWQLDALTEQPLDEVKLPAKIWIRNPDTKALEIYSGPLPGGPEPLPNPMPKVLIRKPWPGALISSLPPTSPRNEAVSYILSNKPVRGKFDPNAARGLGVKHGPDFAKLTSGQSVLSIDGKTITPDMVMGPDRPGGGIAVVDLPSNEYVEPLINRAEWQAEDVMAGVGVIVWILGPGVAANPSLRQFMEAKPNLEHIISSPDHCPNQLSMDGSAASSIRLSQIDLEHYPIPNFDNKTLPQNTFRAFNSPKVNLPTALKMAQRGQIIQVEPKVEIQNNKIIPPLGTAALVLEPVSQGVIEAANSARTALQDPRIIGELESWKAQLPMADAEVIALGTGSALPSKYRNVSATLVRVPGYGSYLLDAGENTLGQLERVFRPTELIEVLKDLRLIWISHLHADHHLGTVSVIKAWHHVVHGSDSKVPPTSPAVFRSLEFDQRTTTPAQRIPYLAVVSDINMLHYLAEYSSVEDYGYKHIIPLSISPAGLNAALPEPSTLRLSHTDCPMQIIPPHLYPALLGVRNIQAVAVNHCHGAKAVALTFPNLLEAHLEPFKIAYSGDCRPSAHFATIGAGATVLVHEATFEDELIGDARAKKHSTVREALGVGSLMGAKCVMLTHFSQRYQKIPVMDNFWTAENAVTEAIKGEEQEQERLAGIEPEEGEEIRGLMEENAAVDAEAQSEAKKLLEEDTTRNSNRSRSHDMKVVVAFDYMRVKVGDMAKMERLRPALAKLFEEDLVKEETKKAKRLADGDGDADSIMSGGTPPKKGKNKKKKKQEQQGKEKA